MCNTTVFSIYAKLELPREAPPTPVFSNTVMKRTILNPDTCRFDRILNWSDQVMCEVSKRLELISHRTRTTHLKSSVVFINLTFRFSIKLSQLFQTPGYREYREAGHFYDACVDSCGAQASCSWCMFQWEVGPQRVMTELAGCFITPTLALLAPALRGAQPVITALWTLCPYSRAPAGWSRLLNYVQKHSARASLNVWYSLGWMVLVTGCFTGPAYRNC